MWKTGLFHSFSNLILFVRILVFRIQVLMEGHHKKLAWLTAMSHGLNEKADEIASNFLADCIINRQALIATIIFIFIDVVVDDY